MSAFNIEEYINSLPDNIEKINISYKSLTYIPCLKRFHNLKELYCSNNQLTSLPKLNNSLEILYCYDNQLTSLPKLNNSLQRLYCSNNQLTSLPELNNSLQRLYCSNNQLTSLSKLNDSLQELWCYNNQLTSLPELNHSLQRLYCSNNSLPLLLEQNKHLNHEKRNKINYIVECLYRFKFLFWSLKCKQKFRDWLWLKVRLPKIENMYHPSKLYTLLHDKNDDITEEELDRVISAW